jgi:hypothetical protein
MYGTRYFEIEGMAVSGRWESDKALKVMQRRGMEEGLDWLQLLCQARSDVEYDSEWRSRASSSSTIEVLLAAENDKARHDLLLGGMRFIRWEAMQCDNSFYPTDCWPSPLPFLSIPELVLR